MDLFTGSDTSLLEQELQVVLDGEHIRFISQPGIEYWDQVSPADRLLLENIPPSTDRNILLRGISHGAWGAAVARKSPSSSFTLSDNNFLHLSLAARTLKLNRIQNAAISTELIPSGKYDIIAIQLPKGRKLSRRWLAEAFNSLILGGELYLAGPNHAGIKSVARDASELFGNPLVLAYKKSNRILKFTHQHQANIPSWFYQPGIHPGSWYEYKIQLFSRQLVIKSLPGVFSYNQIDDGTRLLLDTLPSQISGSVLDFGCGTGILGLAAAYLGAETVDMIDIDSYAIASTELNTAGIDYAKFQIYFGADLTPVSDHRYNMILANLPFHSGRDTNFWFSHHFIQQSRSFLQTNGELITVANRFIDYEKILRESFSHIECLNQTPRYKILRTVP